MSEVEPTRQRLLDAAGQVFAEKGYKATSVRDICHLAGVKNIAAVNYYFGDKEQLYIAAVKNAGEACARRVPLPQWTAVTPAVVKLRDFITTFLARVTAEDAPEWHVRLLMREVFQPSAACLEFVRNFVRPNFAVLEGILQELLPAGVSERERHLIGFSIVGQCLHYRINRHISLLLVGEKEFRTYSVERLADHITRFSLTALGHALPDDCPGGVAS